MSSSIFFRFKSQKEPLQITFDGTSLSVFEVKRDIITLSKLGDGTDFDLEIYAADSNEKYDDDTTQIPRSSTVIARRLPASRPGAGKAARYVTGKMPVNAKNAHRIESSHNNNPNRNTPTMQTGGPIGAGKEMTEEEKLQAILTANTQSWKAEQEAASHKPVVRQSYNKSTPVPDKPLPPGYICHRCGEKGHWIQACPTNNDPNFDNRPKFRRTTGIPRSFLKVVEKPTEMGEDGKLDVSKLPQGVMYTANGEWVIAEPDKATWDKIQEKTSAAAEKAKEAASGDAELRERGLECPIHKGAFNEPVKTPCCGKTYCKDCIENALLDADLLCPNCGEQVLLDGLEPDDEVAGKMKEFEEEKKAERAEKSKEASKSPAAEAAGTPKEGAKSPSAVPDIKVDGAESAASTPNSKKRAAEDELPNDRKPANPAEANKSKQGTPAPPTGPASSSNTPKPNAQPPMAPAKDMAEFQKQMSAMAASMSGMQGGMPAMMNPMMNGFNPAMMGMGMGGFGPGMMGMGGMGGYGPMGGMGGMNMNGMGNMNGWGGNNQMMGNGGWQNGGGNGGWQNNGGRGGMQGGGNANNGPYMRQPVNQRGRGRGGFQRGRGDYRQL
ncbi:Protein mpe1 [Saxophila tyrrhenica]|uniref:Protein mpe1 n=1 Tax=Saxophila tyrrhenica TaxID=1690608 RepID=A0AAV9P8A1_9PEZI|nr:Protein mpe1 [Saxophila tyrrhenica]